MCVWFVVLAVLGALEHRARARACWRRCTRCTRSHSSRSSPLLAFLALGAVVLAVTGTEALYADMGHFGRSPIRRAWLFFVMPALVLNYFGQGALILADPAAVKNPFYLLAPAWALLPLVVLATCADGHRVAGRHLGRVLADARRRSRWAIARASRSSTRPSAQIGQIYVPFINWTLLTAVIAARRRLPQLEQPGRRLRHRRDAGDADRLDPALRRHAPAVELAHRRSRSLDRRPAHC